MTEINQIKIALERVNGGTWIAQEDCQICKGNGFTIFDTEAGFERDECSCLIPENRLFNAIAPDYISSLITTIESQKEEIEALRRSLTSEAVKNANIQKELIVYKKSYDALLLQIQEGNSNAQT